LSNRASNIFTLEDSITSSGREFHGLITLTAKLYFLMSSRAHNFNEWPLVLVLAEKRNGKAIKIDAMEVIKSRT